MARRAASRVVTSLLEWFLPSFALVLGLVILAVSWLGGHPADGAISLGVLAAFGLFVLLAGRSETTARGRSGSPYDWLLAVGGLAYVLAVAYFRRRG